MHIYIPWWVILLMKLSLSVRYVIDYVTYVEQVTSRNRYGRHGRRKAN